MCRIKGVKVFLDSDITFDTLRYLPCLGNIQFYILVILVLVDFAVFDVVFAVTVCLFFHGLFVDDLRIESRFVATVDRLIDVFGQTVKAFFKQFSYVSIGFFRYLHDGITKLIPACAIIA